MVPIFVLADRVTEVVEEIKDTVEDCDSTVIGENHKDAMILGLG